MATDIQIQTGVALYDQPVVVRGSDGTLYAVYAGGSGLSCAYSTDGGQNWSEVSVFVGAEYPAVAIDSQDIVHVVYNNNAGTESTCYRQFTIAGGWGSEETVSAANPTSVGTAIAIDSVDNVHVVYVEPANVTALFYNKRTAGSWGASTSVYSPADGAARGPMQMATDSNNHIYIAFCDGLVSNSIRVLKYNGSSWDGTTQIGPTSVDTSPDSSPSLAIDSADNVHVVWHRSTDVLAYSKYTKTTDLWSAEVVVTTSVTVLAPTISVDADDNLTVLFATKSGTQDIYIIRNTGSWGAESLLLDATAPNDFLIPYTQSTVWPVIGGLHTNIPTAGYHFTYKNDLASDALRYYASADIDFPAPQTENYSRAAAAALPATDSNLSHLFTASEYSNVAVEDGLYANQTATDQYAIHEFKNKNASSAASISVSWTGKSSIAPSTSTVYLQIYNRDSGLWETIDSNAVVGAGANFTLAATVSSNLSDYYDNNNWVSCRVYQLAQ